MTKSDIRDLISGRGTTGTQFASRAISNPPCRPFAPRRPQLVVLDIWLQGSTQDGIGLLDTIKGEQFLDVGVVMISGCVASIETAVASIKKGAYDFVEKPFKADRLLHGGGTGVLEFGAAEARSAGTQIEGGR